MSWVNNLDALASAGVLEYDAAADIKGVAPRYFGNPDLAALSGQLPEMKTQPQKDEFKKEETIHHNPAWKKWLFAGVIAMGLFLGVKNIKGIKEAINKIDFKGVKDLPKKALDGIKNLWGKFTGLFKGKKSATT